MNGSRQYLRRCNLVVANDSGDGLDLSELRIVFAVKKTDGQTPNTANIRVYGLAENTANRIQSEFTQVFLQGGYEANYGVIFTGNVKRVRKGKENGTDTFIEIQAADGDEAYNFAVVNSTIAAGAQQRDQIEQAAKVLKGKGVDVGYIAPTQTEALPRGKVMYGMARDYLRNSSETVGASWSIQDGKLQLVPLTGVLPGLAVVLNSKTGLVGQPEQTNTGLKFRCLLNPLIAVGGAIRINQADIAEAQLETSSESNPANTPPALADDGFYRVISLELAGDSRGNDWYCEGVALDIDATVSAGQSVQVS